jgi:hypothetical protein
MGSLFRLPLLKGTRTFAVQGAQGAVITVIIVVKELQGVCVLEKGKYCRRRRTPFQGMSTVNPVPSHTRRQQNSD